MAGNEGATKDVTGLVPAGVIQDGQVFLSPQALQMRAMAGMGGGAPMGGFPPQGMPPPGYPPPGYMPPGYGPQAGYMPVPMQTGGINWQAVAGGLNVVAGSFQKMTQDVLTARAQTANEELAQARAESAQAIQALQANPADSALVKAAIDKLAAVDDKAQAAVNAQQRLNVEQSRQPTYQALGGAADLAAAFSRQVMPVPMQPGMPMGYPGYGYPGYGGGGGGFWGPALLGVGGGLLAANLLSQNSTTTK